MKRHKTPEAFIKARPKWEGILRPLRDILRASDLEETMKWGVPTYTLSGKNVVGLAAFKHHVALWFLQGALLKDPAGVLLNAQEGRTRAQRQWRFEAGDAVDADLVRRYVVEAVENQRQGRTVEPAAPKRLKIPPELAVALKSNPDLKRSFDALAPYKQRQYAEHVASAKREATRAARLKKILPMIRAGEGLNDRYR